MKRPVIFSQKLGVFVDADGVALNGLTILNALNATPPEARLNEAQLLFVYESILTEMRKFAPQNETIGGWVRRLDFARDEAGVSPQPIPKAR